ncbi:transglycosylase family protein [Kitasatospora sp. NPDC092948]|uniref:transglycosylase family protein n=1 Tax=Kitasatospora sp. NPDC092948 TaxID=3364088 RepID=UPI0037F5CCD9
MDVLRAHAEPDEGLQHVTAQASVDRIDFLLHHLSRSPLDPVAIARRLVTEAHRVSPGFRRRYRPLKPLFAADRAEHRPPVRAAPPGRSWPSRRTTSPRSLSASPLRAAVRRCTRRAAVPGTPPHLRPHGPAALPRLYLTRRHHWSSAMPLHAPRPALRRRTAASAALIALAVPFAAASGASATSVAGWDQVAQCESSGNWSINTGNSYYGGLQISLPTWKAFSGLQYAARPDLATKQQQILIAEKILAGQGPTAWSTKCNGPLYTDHANPYPSSPPQVSTWKAQVLVNGGGGIYHSTRDAAGNWAGFANIASQTGDIGTVGSIADAGINGDTHVVAVGGDGHVYHAIRFADGTWSGFGDVNSQAGALPGTVTKLSAVSIGNDLHVLAVAGGKLFHAARLANGTWSGFADVSSQAGSPGAVVTSASAASVAGQLQVAAVADGRVVHTIRTVSGTWGTWGDVYTAAGNVGVASDVAVAGTGNDMQIVVTTAGGTKQYHGARLANGTWMPLTDLTSSLGSFTATGVSAASVDSELQLTFVTNDDRILHAIRHVNGSWQPAAAIPLAGVYGNHYAASITGSL